MRIAICTDQYLPMLSGIADSVDILAKQLIRNGHSVRIYTLSLPGAESDPNVMRLPTYTVPGSGDGIAVVLPWGAMKDIRAFQPEIVHTHLVGVVGFFAWYAARRLKVPLIGTDHTFPADYLHYIGLDYRPFRYFVRRFSAWYYNRCVYVTAPSKNMLKELADHHCIRPMRVISNHIPSAVFQPLYQKKELKEKYGISEKAILIFGRIAREKNLDFALDIFAKTIGQTEAQLVFVGDGPYRTALEKKVARTRFSEHVRFFGALRGEVLVEVLNACDVFLITSLSETQSMTTLQAMACGVPVVVVQAGGLPEYVDDAVTGYIVDPKDKNLFTQRLSEILKDPALAQQLGERGTRSIIKFSPENITAQFEEVYRTAVYESTLQ
jgi:1,2-diacylglycerol 3-alpha-glucosyltransferase